jgi:hypothetical protein
MNAQRNKKTSNGKGKIMRRGLICTLLLIMAMASNSYAEVLIGDWEASTNEGWADHPATAATGWSATVYVDDPAVNSSIYEFSSDWSTAGTKSLKANVTGWSWFERIDVHTYWYDHSRIEFDIYAVAQGGSTATYAQVEKMAGSTETNGWFDMATAQFNIGLGGTGTHCVFDYAAAGFRTSEYFGTTDSYGSIIIAYSADAPVYMYIDNVRLVTLVAHDPSPADEETGVSLTPTLSWTAGDYTQSTGGHNVYLGTDFDDVNDANTADITGIYLGDTNDPNYVITTPLTASTLYYWRVDEVNDTDGNSPWKSDVWAFNTLGNATITKCQIKAGKTQGADSGDINNIKDSIQLAGTADFPTDANQITQLDINIISVADDNEIIYSQTITDINASLNDAENKISYTHKITKGTAGAIYRLKLDFVNSKFSIYAKNVDLTGLGSPVKLELVMPEIGAIITGEANETIANGRKRIHSRLMRMYQDTLVVTKARARHTTRVMSDSLSVKGEIAVEDINNTDMNEPNLAVLDVNFIWGDQTFTLLAGDLVAYKTGHKYKCRKVPSDANEGVITATFDLDKCTFNLSIKEVNNLYALPDYPDVNFCMNYGIGDANNFNETADVNLVTRRSY